MKTTQKKGVRALQRDNHLQGLTPFLDIPLDKLIAKANEVRKQYIGANMELCSIINAKSGRCGEDCKFCAQSARHSSDISVYPLISKEKIVKAAKRAKGLGAQKFGIVTSGNRPNKKELAVIAEAIKQIKEKIRITVCASLGALNKDELMKLKQAGLSRYHHNIETSPRFYSEIVSTHNFAERINTIKAAKKAGLEVCSGGIIGMGEAWQDRIDMANILKELDVDSAPINILVPVKGTALMVADSISFEDIIRTICIFRIILKDKTIKIAAGRETALSKDQAKGFLAGANGMLIGGYLTLKGRPIVEDRNLIKKIKRIWKQ